MVCKLCLNKQKWQVIICNIISIAFCAGRDFSTVNPGLTISTIALMCHSILRHHRLTEVPLKV